jgi:hypothetical protein
MQNEMTATLILPKIAQILQGIVEQSKPFADRDIVAHALLCFLTKAFNTTRSIDCLAVTCPQTAENDINTLLRSVYDAYLQAAYLAHDSGMAVSRAQDFRDFDHVERRKLWNHIFKHQTSLSRFIAAAPQRPQAEAAMNANFDRVKSRFNNGKQSHWYPGSLETIATKVGKGGEYANLLVHLHGSVHSSFRVMTRGPAADVDRSSAWSLFLAARIAQLIVNHTGLEVSEEAKAVLDCAATLDVLAVPVGTDAAS